MGTDEAESSSRAWAVTKLRRPILSDAVRSRPRLSSILDRAVAAQDSLVLVSAPAGSGKSTAIASWAIDRPDLRTAWLQVDAADNDPIRFWSAALEGLAANQPEVARLQAMLRAPKVDFEHVMPHIVNVLDHGDPTVLVLDDYHLIDNESVHRAVETFVETAPAHVTVVLSTRIDPPLRLGRLRVHGQMSEIRVADLRFEAGEAAAFFADADLTESDLETLCERTEGWAAGLVLAAISLARSPDPADFIANFAGDNRMVVDYLSSELWDNLPEQVQHVFLELSVLDKMCGSLVDALLDADGQGAGWLQRAAADNQLVIALDDVGIWYRFHHLLQDLLRIRLEVVRPGRIPELHRRAAAWHLAHGDPSDAIRHALAGDDLALAIDLVGTHGSQVFSRGELVTVQLWLDQLGEERVRSEPRLAVLQVWTMVVGGDHEGIEERIADVIERLAERVDGDADMMLLEGSIRSASAVYDAAQGNIESALATIEAVVAKPGRFEVTPLVTGTLGMCRTWRGRSADAIDPLERSAAAAPAQGEHLIAAVSTMFLAVNACWTGDLGRAQHMARAALEHADEHGLGDYHQIALAHSVIARTSESDDPTEAAASAARGTTLARRSHRPVMLAYALISEAEVAIRCGEEDERATTLLVEARQLLERCRDPGIVLTMLAQAEALAGRRAAPRPADGLAPADQLTERELTVLRLLPSQLSVREISSELFVSHNTVKGHIKAVYRKLGVNDRALAIQRARELRLL